MRSTESNLLDSLREIGQEPDRVLALAASGQMKATLQTETDTARALGIFWRAHICNRRGTLLGRRSIERCYCVASADRLKTPA